MLNIKTIEKQPSSLQNQTSIELDNSTEDDANNQEMLLNHKCMSFDNKIEILNTKQQNQNNLQPNQIGNYEKIIIERKQLKNKMNQKNSKAMKQKIEKFLKALFLFLIFSFMLFLGSPFTLKALFIENNNIEQKDLKVKTVNLMTQQKQKILLQNDNLIQSRLPQQIKSQKLDLISYNKLKTQNKLLKKLLKIQLQNQQSSQQQQNKQLIELKQLINQINLNKELKLNKINQVKQILEKQKAQNGNNDKKQSKQSLGSIKSKQSKQKQAEKQIKNSQASPKIKPQQNKDLPTKPIIQTQNNSNSNKKISTVIKQNTQIITGVDSHIKLSQLLNTMQQSEQDLKHQAEFVGDRQKCKKYVTKTVDSLRQLYQPNVDFLTFKANSRIDAFQQNNVTNITKEKYREAIELIDLIHRVDEKGNVKDIEENPCEYRSKIRNRLINSMNSQFERLNNSYQINQYHSKQLRFCIVVNSYNNAHNGLIYRNIDSILQQNYTNYHVVYTDDKSPDRTGELVKQYLEGKATNPKFKIKLNNQKVGMMQNIYQAISNDCQLGQIAVMLDGDDSFIGTNVLSFLNAVYQKQKIALMWNNFISIFTNSRASVGFSSDFNEYSKERNAFRSQGGFPSSHLKSFYVDLFRKIKVEDLKYKDEDKFYGGASDLATMYPMIQMTNDKQNRKFKYIPEILYQYRFDTGQLGMTTNRQSQFRTLVKLQNTAPYKPLSLSQYSFIDQAIKRALQIKTQ